MDPVFTRTSLSTSPTSPVVEGTRVTLTATVTPPLATGTVQFKDGTRPLGPPVTVVNGTAAGTTSRLLFAGSHQLRAVFTPNDEAAFQSSTSRAVLFVVAPVGP
jgi:hypothetical protein